MAAKNNDTSAKSSNIKERLPSSIITISCKTFWANCAMELVLCASKKRAKSTTHMKTHCKESRHEHFHWGQIVAIWRSLADHRLAPRQRAEKNSRRTLTWRTTGRTYSSVGCSCGAGPSRRKRRLSASSWPSRPSKSSRRCVNRTRTAEITTWSHTSSSCSRWSSSQASPSYSPISLSCGSMTCSYRLAPSSSFTTLRRMSGAQPTTQLLSDTRHRIQSKTNRRLISLPWVMMMAMMMTKQI